MFLAYNDAVTSLILHNVRSSYNVGAVLRTADASGVTHVYLIGYTPTPKDAFGRTNNQIAKTALGAEKTVPWSHHKTLRDVLKILKKESTHIIAVEQVPRARNYKTYKAPKKSAFLFGNEPRGLSKQAVSLCDAAIEIPMKGTKESLNVSVAVGIILFHYL